MLRRARNSCMAFTRAKIVVIIFKAITFFKILLSMSTSASRPQNSEDVRVFSVWNYISTNCEIDSNAFLAIKCALQVQRHHVWFWRFDSCLKKLVIWWLGLCITYQLGNHSTSCSVFHQTSCNNVFACVIADVRRLPKLVGWSHRLLWEHASSNLSVAKS